MSKGLLTLQTDLKSLRYGSDKPYITKDINNAPSSNQAGMQGNKRVDDLSRIAQMLVDRPGLKHLGNEALLRQVGVQDRIEKSRKSGKSVAGALLKELGGTALTTVKVVGSTIAQVPVNGTGTHFLRGFRTDTYLQPTNGNQFSQFASFFGAGGVEGAPSAIKGQEIVGNVKSALLDVSSSFQYNAAVRKSSYGIENWNEIPNKKVEDVLPPLRSSELSKNGGIVSVTGKEVSSKTTGGGTIEGTDFEIPTTTTADSRNTTETTKSPGQLRSISNQFTEQNPSPGFVSITGDAPKISGDKSGDASFNPATPTEYTYLTQKTSVKSRNGNVTKESRILLGDQGARNDTAKKLNQYWTTDSAAIDRINAQIPSTGKVTGETEGRDLIKFRFHILTADGVEKVLYFRAFLDSFADNFSGQWNPVKYLGRAEDFQVYGGFQRKINLSFKIAAATRAEMQPIYQKMVYLASATAPTYASGGQFMRGTLTKITVGDYIYELPGVLNSVNYTWNVDYPWEIAMVEPENTGADDFEQELPMVMDCSIDFTPIHTFTPTTGLREYITTRLTEKGKQGIKNIENTTTGIQSEPPKEVVDPVKPTPTYRPIAAAEKYKVQF